MEVGSDWERAQLRLGSGLGEIRVPSGSRVLENRFLVASVVSVLLDFSMYLFDALNMHTRYILGNT